MFGLTSVRGKEAGTFASIARFVQEEAERPAAIQALVRIPQAEWPKESAKPLLDVLIGSIRKLPVADRTSDDALASMQFAEALKIARLFQSQNVRMPANRSCGTAWRIQQHGIERF